MEQLSVLQLINLGLNGKICKIPYQRDYVWKERHMLDLLNSMLNERELGIGDIRCALITKQDETWDYVQPLFGMDDVALDKKGDLKALVDFQQRCTTFLLFARSNNMIKKLYYSVKDGKFVKKAKLLDRDTKNYIGVDYFFKTKTSDEREYDKRLEEIGVHMDVIDKIKEIKAELLNVTIPMYESKHMSLEKQCSWFNRINGTGVKTTEFDTISNTLYVKSNKSLNVFAKEVMRIANNHGYAHYNSLPSNTRNKTVSALILPLTMDGFISRSVPYAGELNRSVLTESCIQNITKAYGDSLRLFDKVCTELKGVINIDEHIQLSEMYFVFAKAKDINVLIDGLKDQDKVKRVQKQLDMFKDVIHHNTGGTRKTKMLEYAKTIIDILGSESK